MDDIFNLSRSGLFTRSRGLSGEIVRVRSHRQRHYAQCIHLEFS